MKYSIANMRVKNAPKLYTVRLLDYLIEKHGHDRGESAIIVSLCDITEIGLLKKTREDNPWAKIIVGGHLAALAPRLLSVFADAVVVGHGFDFFKAKTWDEIKSLPNVYTGHGTVNVSQYVDFANCPIIQINKRVYSILGAVGCKNKCKFCVTSWTNRHQKMPKGRRLRALRAIPKGATLKVIENEGDLTGLGNAGAKVHDMMLKDFLRTTGGVRVVRCGIEFATEDSRKYVGKPVADEQVRAAFKHAKKINCDLFLFFIGGRNTKEEWLRFAEEIIPADITMKPRVFLKFTNFEPQPLTPLYGERRRLNLDNYIDQEFTQKLFRIINAKNKRVRIYPVKYPAHAIWRMGMTAVETRQQFEKMWPLRNCKDISRVYDAAMMHIDNDAGEYVKVGLA